MSRNNQFKKPVQIFKLLKDQLQLKSLKLSQIYFQYDRDKDTFLNVTEITAFLKDFVPTITQEELNTTIDFLNPFKAVQPIISLYQLLQILQDDEFFIQNQKSLPLREAFKDYEPTDYKPIEIKFDNQPSQVNIQPQPSRNLPTQIIPNQVENKKQSVPDEGSEILSSQDDTYFVIAHPHVSGVKEFVTTFHQLQQTNGIFTDQEFPPNNSSLGPDEAQNGYIWLRPKDFKDKQGYSLFENDESTLVKPEDVRQGQLGDCYFLSSLSAITNKSPHIIETLFLTKRTNPYGIYCVYLNINGVWQTVMVDDYFPCLKDGNPAYSQSVNKELWVMILEKAWAKVFGSYQNIIAGNPREVLKALTGGITWTFLTNDQNFEGELQDGYNQKSVMVSGTQNKQQLKDQMERMGFVVGHAYSVLKSYDDPNLDNQMNDKVKLVKLRNPWGKKEWIGDWSDQSSLWTPELKKKYKVENRDDGVFYMAMKDFRYYFNDVEFLYFRDSYKYVGVNAQFSRHHGIYFQVDIQKKGEYYFTVNQEDERFYRSKGKPYQYSPVRMILINSETNEVMFGKQGVDREVWAGGELKNRRYWLYVKIEWNNFQEKEVFVSAYGETKANIKQIPKIESILNDCFKEEAKKNTNWKPYQQGIQKCSEFKSDIGFGYFCFQNTTINKTLESTIRLSMQGLKLRKPDRDQQIIAKVGPGETKTVVVEINYRGFSMSNQESYRII